MKPITFTQFLLPAGRRVTTEIERSDPIADKAAELVAAGCRLEIEMLTTGEISMAVEHDEATWAIEITPNGPEVPIGVDKIICDAYDHLKSLTA
jgi:hypothetical protein